MVQQELHPQDEGREVDGDPSQPVADQAAAGVPEAVAATDVSLTTGLDLPAADLTTAAVDMYAAYDAPSDMGQPGESGTQGLPDGFTPEPSEASAEASIALSSAEATAAQMRLEYDDRSAMYMHRLNVWKDELVAWFKTLASAAVYATLIVTFGFQVARVEGQSMAPTLADQDRLIVNKLAYRMGEPRRGDIVMLYYPLNPDKSFVKRVMAQEGDQVRIVDGRVFVNDVPTVDDFVLPEYRSHDDFGPTIIPEGYDFVMGDHRNNSSDSRHWGMVPKRYIIGRVQLRWWPIPTARVF